MRKLILLTAVTIVTFRLYAQKTEKVVTVQFQSNESKLSENATKAIDNALLRLADYPYKEIQVTAHTDHEGSAAYNQNLSKNRAESVKTYLDYAGIDSKFVKVSWHGENKPVADNKTETGMANNRRVEIHITAYQFADAKSVLKAMAPDYKQSFKLKQGDNLVIGKKGTKISIPADAFVTKNGKSVQNEDVEFVLEEYQSAADFIFNGTSAQSKGKMLQSGGMMRLTAQSKGEELELKKDKNLKVDLPVKDPVDGMMVFTGERTSEGIVDWTITNNSFNAAAVNVSKRKSFKFDEDDLRSLIVPDINIADSNLISGGIIIKLPTMVKSMTKPKKPIEPAYPSLRETANSFWYMLLPKAVLKQRAEKLYKRRYNNYEKHLQTYEKRLKLYEKNAEVYENANRINEEIERNFYLYLDTLIQKMEHKKATLAKAYGIYRWNYAVNVFIKKNNSDSLFDSNLANNFMNICNSKPNEQMHKELFLTDYDLQLLKGLKWTSFQKMQGIMKSGVLDFDKNREQYVRKLRYNINTWFATSLNQFALEKFQEGTIRAVFSKVNPNGSFVFAQNAVFRGAPSSNTYYVASVTNLGYINCDKFYNYRPNEMMVLNIKRQQGEAVVLYIDKYRSLLYPNYSTMETVQFSIPKTAAAKILVNGLDSGLPTFQIIDITRNKGVTAYQTEAKEVLLSQMEKMLREL